MKVYANEVRKHWPGLEEALGYSFQNKDLLAEALTHPTYANECHAVKLPDNERLEFLGDAVLDLVISEYLMTSLPESPEGQLTRLRADVVCMPGLARLAGSLNVGSALLLGKGEERNGGREKPNLLADAFESLIGAIFTDGGFAAAKSVVLPLFVPMLHEALSLEDQDFKSRLQELLQASQRALPVYKLVETTGPAHERTFFVEVLVGNCVTGSGQGRTKKSAEQSAAKAALASLDNKQ
jgi:ribonuclease-3